MNIGLKEMQNIETEILKAVHNLCEKYNITYYLGFGTMLGAVRHQGFIPWDDDIDILMPREDYDKFLRIASKELTEPYKLKYPQNTNPYLYDFAKVEDMRTKIIETVYSYLEIDSCIYIDIFPIDGCPSSKILRIIHLKHVEFWQQLLAMYYSDLNKPRSRWKRLVIKLVKKFFNQNVLIKHIEGTMRKYDFSKCNYVGYYEGKSNELIPKRFFGKPTLVEFENQMFWGVENATDYLTALYDDYMKLPLENDRVAHTHSLVEYR